MVNGIYEFKYYKPDLYTVVTYPNVASDLLSDADKSKAEIKRVYLSNNQEIKNMMGIDKKIHHYSVVIQGIQLSGLSDTNILQMKKIRLVAFYDELVEYILSMVHMLYYIKFEKHPTENYIIIERSGKTLTQCLEIALKIGFNIKQTYEDEFDKEFNAQPIMQTYNQYIRASEQ